MGNLNEDMGNLILSELRKEKKRDEEELERIKQREIEFKTFVETQINNCYVFDKNVLNLIREELLKK